MAFIWLEEMQADFNDSAAALSEAEQALKDWGVAYEKQADGTLLVPGDLDASKKNLTQLPDLSQVTVMGNFNCNKNSLTDLTGSPRYVDGGFFCHDNELASLKGSPRHVGGGFYCAYNKLTSLDGAPETIGCSFSCGDNLLTSLRGMPRITDGDGDVPCKNNALETLDGLTDAFGTVYSDFGNFCGWNEIPDALAPDTKRRHEEAAVHAATILSAPVAVRKPLQFKLSA